MKDNRTAWRSFSNTLMQEFLYMFPARAGEVLTRRLREEQETEREAQWYQQVLSFGAQELITSASGQLASEDKCALLDVFLWKQRHGLIAKNLRIRSALGPGTSPRIYYIHRYMVANGYEGILPGKNAYAGEKTQYLEEIGRILDQAKAPDFGAGELGFWDALILLNVLGPVVSTYERLSEVQELAEYTLKHHEADPRLSRLHEDRELSAFTLLLSDLAFEPARTWSEYRNLLLSTRARSVLSYPALIAGIQMYDIELRATLQAIDLQGGRDLFLDLLTP
jgi:hypothetical protein